MNKQQVAQVLREIALLLELKGENSFKIRAYSNGARVIELLEDDLETLVKERRLTEVKGIGSALAEKVSEMVTRGQSDYYKELRASIPEGVLEILRVPGLGPKKVQMLYEGLGISNLRELEYAVKENRLAELPGFGAKTQAKVAAGLDYLKSFQGLYYYAEVLPQALELLEKLGAFPGLKQASLAGSLRRANEIVKDIDLAAAADKPEDITALFTRLPGVKDILSQGDTKASIRLESGLQADLLVVGETDFPYALHHFTGSKEHNTALRHYARNRGFKINEYGLFQGEHKIPCKNEEEIYQALGMSYIPPELREGGAEIEAALRGSLPRLLSTADIKGIFHVHTNMSDGDHSLENMVLASIDLGYEYIGISDHSQSAFYAHGLKTDDIRMQQEMIEGLRRQHQDKIRIFSGIESDIKADGSLDYPDEILASFDFVIASVHSHFKLGEEEQTRRIVKAISHPAVTMLGHPTGRILLARPGYALNMKAVLEAARDYGVIIELNSSPARLDIDWRYLRQAKELGVMISINPDAHRIEELPDVAYGVAVARKGWLTSRDVFNCYEADAVVQYLQERKRVWVANESGYL